MDLRDADDGAVERIYVAARDGLQPVDHLCGGDDRIDPEMRHRRVCAAAPDRDLENVKGGHHRSGPDGELSGRHSGQLCMP